MVSVLNTKIKSRESQETSSLRLCVFITLIVVMLSWVEGESSKFIKMYTLNMSNY